MSLIYSELLKDPIFLEKSERIAQLHKELDAAMSELDELFPLDEGWFWCVFRDNKVRPHFNTGLGED